MMGGSQFVEALSRLGYQQATTLKASEFDWLFDTAPDNLHLLRIVCYRLNRHNALSPEELQAYKALKESGKSVFDADTLAELLKTCPVGQEGFLESSAKTADENLTVEDLETELSALRKEKQLKQRRLNKLQMLATSSGSKFSASQNLLEEGGKLVKDANAALAAENAYTNSTVENLSAETTKLAGLFHTNIQGLPSNDGAPFPVRSPEVSVLLSQSSLEPFLQQLEQFTKTLSAYTPRQFFQGISDTMETSSSNCCHLTDLSSSSENEKAEGLVELMKKETAQLNIAYKLAHYQLVKERAEEKGCEAAKKWLTQQLNIGAKMRSFDPDLHSELLLIQTEIQSLLSNQVRSALQDCAHRVNIPVFRGYIAHQLARQKYFSSSQIEVRNQLIRQKATLEFVRLAQDEELRMEKGVMEQIREVVKKLEKSAEASAQREKNMTQPHLTQDPNDISSKLRIIHSNDASFGRLLQILELGNKSTEREDSLQTYSDLEVAASNLQKELVCVHEALEGGRREQASVGARLERDLETLHQVAYSDIVQPLLRPQVCVTATSALDFCPHAKELSAVVDEMEAKQKTLVTVLQEMVGDLKFKRAKLEHSATLRKERELYVYFHLDPKLLSLAVKDAEAQAGVM